MQVCIQGAVEVPLSKSPSLPSPLKKCISVCVPLWLGNSICILGCVWFGSICVVCNTKCTQQSYVSSIKMWPGEAASLLHDCFQCTDWQMFSEASSQEGNVDLPSSSLNFISKCADEVCTTKRVTIYCNQRTWLNAEVRALLKDREWCCFFRAHTASEHRAARRNLALGIRRVKYRCSYAQKIYTSNYLRSIWKVIQWITNYSTKDAPSSNDPSLPDALDQFFACFAVLNIVMKTKGMGVDFRKDRRSLVLL